jgi:hypothetical protein
MDILLVRHRSRQLNILSFDQGIRACKKSRNPSPYDGKSSVMAFLLEKTKTKMLGALDLNSFEHSKVFLQK